ncbi:MAG: aminotransferase class I/II-fold pyridoxal phosphate-dependent enzyme [Acidimicrobiia bacterium]|nr:aminotransferase class I/II-fold pyridoxal phosphate-dependent enzyme [Acidimicrobiia bacterium]
MPRLYLSPPDIGPEERTLLLEALDSGWVAPLGPMVDRFEEELAAAAGRRHAAALSSGTAALHLAMLLAGVQPGDDVLVPTLTFVATANAVTYTGARPCFIDAEPDTWNLDPALLAAELERRAAVDDLPAAVIPVDLYGRCAEYDAISTACARYGVPVIEDAAEALGASYRQRPAGSFGTTAAFSFNGNKIITTSGGGMLVGDDPDLIARARSLASQARQPVLHYEHHEIGFNYRMSNLLAAVGLGQLRGLPAKIERRRRIAERYQAAFAELDGLDVVTAPPEHEPNFWLTVARVDAARFGATPTQICDHLGTLDIEARPTWKPMHLQPLYADHPCVGGQVAEEVFRTGICLPSGSAMADNDQDRVIEAVAGLAGRGA